MTEPAPVLPLSDFDPEVRVQDDLYRHVNGGWLARTKIPADQPLTGAFIDLRDRAEAAVRDIITGLADGGAGAEALSAGSDEAKIAALYASFMAEDAIERAGAAPLAPLLAEIDAVAQPEDLVRLLGSFARRGVSGLVGLEAESDPGDPSRYVMFLGQDGLGLPDEAYYREDTYASIRTAYREHVASSLALAGVPDASAAAAAVLELETAIAARHWDKVKSRDLRAMYNLRTLDDFTAEAPGLHWRTFLAGAGVPETAMAELVVAQPSFFTDVATLLTAERLPAWRLWATWNVISSLSPYLSSAFVAQRFHFYGTVLSGTPQLKERWKRGVALVEGALGEAVGKVYVERHFSPTAKGRMDALVANLIEAYRRSISDLDWMTEETKAEALVKLAKFRPHIGYPSRWRDYSALAISADDVVANVMAAASFELDRAVAKIGAPVDREEWLMTPQTVNAYYHPLKNEIVFPAAILQPPFFHEEADDAVNYGGIGAVIGHEIGHGFDDQGSTCDGDGALRDWWTAADRTAFETRTAALVEQYDALSPELADGQHVNGRLTIGENIGDLGGLTIAHLAHRIASADAAEPVDGYTPEQRLFLSWGAIWQSKSRPETVKQRLATDPHSPPEFRCNQIVRNLDAFHSAFGVTPDDGLWLPEDERVKIW
ncbi:M13 family metallopeptidase [uncultured Friedmanniella sp.]|uniref:M13 family metallopeptidase n=1 Tax=uncultured Friedmanniella sp. TaxID=335381 RepID=UPI0035CA5963